MIGDGRGVSTVDVTAARRAALRIVRWQASAALLAGAGFLAFSSGRAALSALVGGGIAVVANLSMVLLAFRSAPGEAAKPTLRGFYRGEAAKLGVTVVLLVVALRTGSLDALPMLVAFIATLPAYWIALIRS